VNTRLIVVRHAETTWPRQRLTGLADPPLSGFGREQAEAVAAALAERTVHAVVTSPLARARETALPIARSHSLLPIDCRALREIDLGSWQGVDPSDLPEIERARLARWLDDPSSVTPPGGESLADVAGRTLPAVERLLHEFAGRSLVVVTHSVVGRVLIAGLLGCGLDFASRLRIKRASITELRPGERRAVLVSLGVTSHLRRPVLAT